MKYLSIILFLIWIPISGIAKSFMGTTEEKDTIPVDIWRTKTISEVVVTGVTGLSLIKETPLPFTYISKGEIQSTSSTNIIDAIAHQPGLAQITTGSGISKPVFVDWVSIE